MDTLPDAILSQITSGMDKLNLSSTNRSLRQSMRTERNELKRLRNCYNLNDNLVSCMNLAQNSEFEVVNQNSFGKCYNIAQTYNRTLDIRLTHSFLAENQCALILAMRYATSRKRIRVIFDRELENNEMDEYFLTSVKMLPVIHTLLFDFPMMGNISQYINRIRDARAQKYIIRPSLDDRHTGNPAVFAYTFDYFLNNPEQQTRIRNAIRHTNHQSQLLKPLDILFIKNNPQMNDQEEQALIMTPFVTMLTNYSSDANFTLLTNAQSIRDIQTEDDYGRHQCVHVWWDLLLNLPGHRERTQNDVEYDDDTLEDNDRNGANVLILADDPDLAYLMGLGMHIFDGLKMEFENLPVTNFFALQYLDENAIPGPIN